MSGVVGIADASANLRTDGGCLAGAVVQMHINIRVAECRVDIVIGQIVNLTIGMGGTKIGIRTRHQHSIVQVRRVWHGVLLILEGLIKDVGQLVGILGRETSVVAVRNIVAVSPGEIVEVSDMRLTRNMGGEGGDLRHVAYQQHKRRCRIVIGRVGI